jgi:FMN phosphatase YigB (HAD superfamily)
MNHDWNICLDLDGVIIDLVVPLMRWWGVDIREDEEYPQEYKWDVKGAIVEMLRQQDYPAAATEIEEMKSAKFWNATPKSFWADLQPYDEALNFIDWLEEMPVNLYFATAHTNGMCAGAKFDWLEEHVPGYWNRTMVGHPKHLLAGPRTILIDDRDKNCEDFRAAGGQAILCPRPWNEGYHSHSAFNDFTGERLPVWNVIVKELSAITNFVETP